MRLPGAGSGAPRLAPPGTDALALGEAHGYRNAQTTLIAPTGTIGLLMDCDTTGVEPDFALVKFKKLAGGGYFRIINHAPSREALARLGYRRRADPTRSSTTALGHPGSLEGAPFINRHTLIAGRGFTQPKRSTSIDESLKQRAFHIRFVVQQATRWARQLLRGACWESTR